MAIKVYKPTSPGRRGMSVSTFEEITRAKPERSLLRPLTKSAGRNVRGKVTVRHRGGGAKRRYRKIDFKRTKDGIPAKVAAIEYDPNRSAFIALIKYEDGELSYILAPQRLKAGDTVAKGQPLAVMEAIRGIKAKFPGVRTICGLSNVSFGLPLRHLLNQNFLVLCMAAGLDGVILDPLDKRIISNLLATEALLGRDEFCMGYVMANRQGRLTL